MTLWQILLALWLARVSSFEPSQFRWLRALERLVLSRGLALHSFYGGLILLVLPLVLVDLAGKALAASGSSLVLLFQWLVLFVCLTGPTHSDQAEPQQQPNYSYLAEIVERWLTPVFWFVLAGPVGALAYRLLALQAPQMPMARKARDWAEWLPTRLLALALPLMGHFAAMHLWRSALLTVAKLNRYWLSEVAQQALLNESDSCQQLVKRGLLLLLAGLAVLSLSGALK
jgi:AmpE protein